MLGELYPGETRDIEANSSSPGEYDQQARADNLVQLGDHINKCSAGNAVIVFGGTNARYPRSGDTIGQFKTQAGLMDAFVGLERQGVDPVQESICSNPSNSSYCETTDKVLYRGSKLLDLTAETFSYESRKFLQSNGAVLSDHNPVGVNFTWSLNPLLAQSNFFGGPHGEWFSDMPVVADKSSTKVDKLVFRGTERLDSVSVVLSDNTELRHGGTGGEKVSLDLEQDEFWTTAKLCKSQHRGMTRNFYIVATTSKNRTLSAGTETNDCETFSAPANWQIKGFLGQVGDNVDQLAFIYAPQ